MFLLNMMMMGMGANGGGAIAAATAASQFTAANSEYLSVANDANLQFGNEDFSIAGWVYLDAAGTFPMPFGKWNDAGNTREYTVYYNHLTTKYGFFVSSNGTLNSGVFTTGTPGTGAWHYIVCVHDAANDLLKISLDGAAFDTTAYASGCNANTSAFRMGYPDTSLSGTYLDGRVCKAGIWRKALSDAEVDELYNSGNGLAYCQLSSGLLTSLEGYWNLSESSGTRADSTANANNLADNNTVTGNPGVGTGNCITRPFAPSDYGFVGAYFNANEIVGLSTGDPLTTWAELAHAYNITEATNKPTYRTTDGDFTEFDGTNDKLTGAIAISNIVSASAFTIFALVKVDTIGTNDSDWYDNDAILADTGGYLGLFLKSAGTVGIGIQDGSNNNVSTTITTGAWVVVEARSESGALYISVDGASEQTVACSNITTLTGTLKMGASWNDAAFSDINVKAALIYNTALSSGSRTAIRAALAAL